MVKKTVCIPVRWTPEEVAEIDRVAALLTERLGRGITRSEVIRHYHKVVKAFYDPKLIS